LRVKIATIARRKLGDTPRAFDELQEALSSNGSHPGAIAEVEDILANSEDPEHRARAGEMLEPIYLRAAAWMKVQRALDARLAASQDPAERGELLQRLAPLHAEQLDDYAAALDTLAKPLYADLSDERLWRELKRPAS